VSRRAPGIRRYARNSLALASQMITHWGCSRRNRVASRQQVASSSGDQASEPGDGGFPLSGPALTPASAQTGSALTPAAGRPRRRAPASIRETRPVPQSLESGFFDPGGSGEGESTMPPSMRASSCADGAVTSRPRASPHHCKVDRPNQVGTSANRLAKPTSPSRIAASYVSWGDADVAASASAQGTSAHTVRPR